MRRSQGIVCGLLAGDTLLVGVIALRYSYDALTRLESLAAVLILIAALVVAGLPRAMQPADPPGATGQLGPTLHRLGQAGLSYLMNHIVLRCGRTHGSAPTAFASRFTPGPEPASFGLLVGLLWAVEIGLNNFLAPPLPGRDRMDNLFWGAVAVLLLGGSLVVTWRGRSWRAGVAFGWGSGFASGAVACSMALLIVVFGMHFLLHDPLNVAEWAARPANEPAPRMAAYFAYQTLAGALLHLVVLGALMGLPLGVVGGAIGKVAHH